MVACRAALGRFQNQSDERPTLAAGAVKPQNFVKVGKISVGMGRNCCINC
jgi:hypothetical protein